MLIQSEPYPEELNCLGTFKKDSKLAIGSSKGKLYTFNWGQFGYHCDMFPGLKIPISSMVPITDSIAALAGEDGHVRACNISPFRNLGIIGQHTLPVEAMDISHNGELMATASHNNDIRFWNTKYFEDFREIKSTEKHNTYKERMHNLPSSKYSNAQDFFSDLNKDDDD